MIITVCAVLAVLVALNFFLLFFSCNKNTKKAKSDKREPVYIKRPKVITTELASAPLAPTGS